MTLIKNLESQSIITFTLLVLLMCLTRGSHLLTSVSLPDSSFALFLIGGMLFKKSRWFFSLFTFSVVIDLVTLSMSSNNQIPINLGYFGLLPSYGVMWLFGLRIATSKRFLNFASFGVIATLIALFISTQTYNLLSGTFPDITIKESIQTGWEYLPQSFIYTMTYLMAYWGIQLLFKRHSVSQKATAL